MTLRTRALTAALLSVMTVFSVSAQSRTPESPVSTWALKTNLLYDATATFNLGAEFRLGDGSSLDIPVSYNPWTWKENRKWKHILVQPELRWWPKGTFRRHFWGVHAHYAFYNVGNLPHGPFSTYMQANRFEGWLVGAGISYGYRWNFRNPRWALEATVGAGYAYMDYDRFACGRCGEKLGSETKHYFGPTKAGVSLILALGEKEEPAPRFIPVYVPEPQPKPAPAPVYEPVLTASFVAPEAEAVKTRSESGRAYLDFAVGRSEILPTFRDNAAELQKIHVTIASVKDNPDATITAIRITGHASPEGGVTSNQSLSARRAEALRNHIGSIYGLPNSLIAAYGAGEDWDGLDSLVSASGLPEKYRLLEIIRGWGDADARERQLRSIDGGVPYRQLLDEFYPRLRRSDYTIAYTVVPFTVEQGKEVIKSRPGTLSLNEMFLIADTYTPGSEAFNEVFETAARVFPSSDTANLNAAAAALGRKDTDSAARYLSKVQARTPEYWNNLGVLRGLQGDPAAAESFSKAGAVGAKNAAEWERHIQSVEP